MKPKASLRSFLVIAGSSLLAITCAHAVDWIGGDGTWSTNTNWSDNKVPNATNADVFFIGSSNQNITLDGDYTVRTLGFFNTGSTNIRGNNSGTTARTLTLGTGTTTGINVYSGAGAVTIGDTPGTYGAVNIALNANQTWTNHSENLLTITGSVINLASNTLTIGGSGNTTISGGINIGAVNFTKTGLGTLTLAGANGYTGGTYINGGKLVLDMDSGGSLNSASILGTSAPASPLGIFEIKGKSGAFASAQTMGNLSMSNNTYLKIVLDPNNATGVGNGTTLTLGDAWTIPFGILIDYSSSNTGIRQVVTANATTGVTLADGIYQKVLVKDINGVTGFGTRSTAPGTQAITRYDDATLSTVLTSAIPTSNTVNYTTLGAGASVTMTNVTRAINSLVVDTTDNAFALDTGANTLTIDTAILFRGGNNATISGGIIATNYIYQVGTGDLTINNVISSSTPAKAGSGTLVLSGNNTFTGTMNIFDGIVKLGAAGNGTNTPLGTAAGNTDVNVGGALDLNGITLSTAEPLGLFGSGVSNGGALTNSGGNAAFSGLLTIKANASIVASGGDINLTNTGTTSILNGLIVGGAKNTTIAAILSGTATTLLPTALTKQGTGTLALSASNTYTGGTILNAGTLKLDYATNNTSKLSSTATFGTLLLNGGTLELSGGSHVETVLSTTLNAGGTFIKQTNSGTSTLSMGLITFSGGAIDFAAGSVATTTSTVTNGILSQRATVAGTNFAMKSGSDIVAYDYATSGSTSYTGATMSANTNYALQTAGGANTLSGTTGDTSNTLRIANTATGSLAVGANALTLGAILFAGSADYDITTSGSGSVTPSILHNFGTGGAALNLGALGGALSQFGTGKTILSNDATAAGGLAVNGGTVQISSNAQIGLVASGAGITLNNGTLLASETLTLDNSGANKRNITLGAGGGTLAAASTKTLTVSGVVSGAVSGALSPLTLGSGGSNGTVVLSGTNTYTGATTVQAGTLLINGDNSAAIGAVSVAAGATNATAVRLEGIGTVGGNTTFAADPDAAGAQVGGIHSPGASVGKQTFDQAGAATTSLTYNAGSIFEWELAATPAATVISDESNYTSNRGTAYDAVNVTGTVSGSGAIFRIVLDGTQTFSDTFWNASREWTDIFRNGDGTGSANVSNWASVFSGGFQYYNYSGDGGALASIAGPTAGSFSLSGNTLSYNFAAIPEPTTALAGLLLTAGLLRRRRRNVEC